MNTTIATGSIDADRQRIRRLNNASVLVGGLALLLQLYGTAKGWPSVTLVGLLVLIGGYAAYAKMRGRSPWWGLVGLAGPLGLIVLACLSKRCARCGATVARKADTCPACGGAAPL